MGVLAIGLFWLLGMILVPVGAVLLMAPKRPRAARPPRPKPAPKPAPVRTSPPVKTSPTYLRRWGIHRRAWAISEKAQWQLEFDRLLSR
jgi:hypothetical protein